MAGWGTRVSAAIDALVSLWSSAGGDLDGVWVVDGAPVGNDSATVLVAVGYSDQDGIAVQGETAAEGWAGQPNRESFTINCAAAAFDGAGDQATARSSAFVIYEACLDALSTDPTLGGVCLRALPGPVTVTQSQTTRGAACNVQFTVSVDAFTA